MTGELHANINNSTTRPSGIYRLKGEVSIVLIFSYVQPITQQ